MSCGPDAEQLITKDKSGVEVCQVIGYERGQTKRTEKPSQLSLAAECVCVCVSVCVRVCSREDGEGRPGSGCPGGGNASLRPALACYPKTDQQMAGALRESQGPLGREEGRGTGRETDTDSILVCLRLHSKIP